MHKSLKRFTIPASICWWSHDFYDIYQFLAYWYETCWQGELHLTGSFPKLVLCNSFLTTMFYKVKRNLWLCSISLLNSFVQQRMRNMDSRLWSNRHCSLWLFSMFMFGWRCIAEMLMFLSSVWTNFMVMFTIFPKPRLCSFALSWKFFSNFDNRIVPVSFASNAISIGNSGKVYDNYTICIKCM